MQTEKPRPRHGWMAFWMILLGLQAAAGGAIAAFSRWVELAPAFQVHCVLFLFTGIVMVAAGVWLLAVRSQKRRPLVAGGLGAGLAGVNMLLGLAMGTIPCSGPS